MSDCCTAEKLAFCRRGKTIRSIPVGRSDLLRRNASRTSRLRRLRAWAARTFLRESEIPNRAVVAAVFDAVNDQDFVGARAAPVERRGGSLWGLSVVRAGESCLQVHDDGSTSWPGGSSGRTMRGGFKRSRIRRPRRMMCQIKRPPSAASVTRPVPSKAAMALPSRGRASGFSSRICRSRLRGVPPRVAPAGLAGQHGIGCRRSSSSRSSSARS